MQVFADELTDGAVDFEFDNVLDILFDMDKSKMERNGLTEENMHLLKFTREQKKQGYL